MKILITGSHFTPAQALIEKLLEIPDIKIVYLGRKFARDDDKTHSAESKVLPKFGIKFIPIYAGKLNRFFSIQTIISFLLIPVGFLQAFYYLLKEKPDIIVSFGGFTGLPVVLCGWLLSIPSIIHEQGLKMGLSNSISAAFAQKFAVSFPDFKPPFFADPKKIIVTGNPIRSEILNNVVSPGPEIKKFINDSKKDLVFITAGNQGSHFINLTVEDKLSELTKIASVIHQTGDSKYDDFSNLSKFKSENYLALKWIDAKDFSYVLDHADLAVCRGGINTLLELSLKSVPSLIIPIHIGGEQKENAKYFTKLGLGETFPEKEITPDTFIEKIKEMLSKKVSIKKSAEKTKTAVIMDAEKRLLQEVLLLENSQDKYLQT